MKDVDAADTQKDDEEIKSYWCTLKSKSDRAVSVHVSQDLYSVGRSANNNLVLKDSKVSGKHCAVQKEKDNAGEFTYTLIDYSTNGTFLNGTKVKLNEDINR